MPEANQYVFTNAELLEMLIKKAGVHDGRWSLLVNFGIGTGSMGPTPESLSPGLSIILGSVGIQKAPDDAPANGTADAALVNPKAAKSKKS